MANKVELSPGYFPLKNLGRPIALGQIYVGIVDLDPEVPANQKQISVLQEDGSIIEVGQPIRTSLGGVPQYSGHPVTIMVGGSYSLKVLNMLGGQEYYVPSNSERDDYNVPVDTIAALRAMTGDFNNQTFIVSGYYAPGDGGGGPLRIWKEGAAPGTYENNGGSSIWPDGGDGSAAWVFSDVSVITIESFGAKDGSDSTASIQSALDTDYKHIIGANGSYLVSSALTSDTDGRTIDFTKCSLVGTVRDTKILTVNGDNCTTHLVLDGGGLASTGIEQRGDNFDISDCDITNLSGLTLATLGVLVLGDIGGKVYSNRFKNINGVPNGILGDAPGASRGVFVSSTSSRTKRIEIYNNELETITGEEGDGIQILCNDGSAFFLNANVEIRNNTITNCNRRAIKIQAANCKVIGNTHVNTLDIASLVNASSLIDVIASSDVTVRDNELDALVGFSGITVSGVAAALMSGNIVEDNRMIVGTDVASGVRSDQTGVYIDQNTSAICRRNKINGSTAHITFDNSTLGVIKGNTITAGDGGIGINIPAACSEFIVSGNESPSGELIYLIQNAAPDCIITDNHIWNNTAQGGCIRTYITSAGSMYRNNSNRSDTTTVLGDYTDQAFFNNANLGAGSSGLGNIRYTVDIPSTVNPTTKANRGDVAFSTIPVAGGTVGWSCVSSGVPGSWKPFGTISS